VPQQVAGFLEGRIAREIVDVVSAIREHAAIAVEKTDARRGRDDVFETAFGFSAVAISGESYQHARRRLRAWLCRLGTSPIGVPVAADLRDTDRVSPKPRRVRRTARAIPQRSA
jgi:hypothetical protein